MKKRFKKRLKTRSSDATALHCSIFHQKKIENKKAKQSVKNANNQIKEI